MRRPSAESRWHASIRDFRAPTLLIAAVRPSSSPDAGRHRAPPGAPTAATSRSCSQACWQSRRSPPTATDLVFQACSIDHSDISPFRINNSGSGRSGFGDCDKSSNVPRSLTGISSIAAPILLARRNDETRSAHTPVCSARFPTRRVGSVRLRSQVNHLPIRMTTWNRPIVTCPVGLSTGKVATRSPHPQSPGTCKHWQGQAPLTWYLRSPLPPPTRSPRRLAESRR